MKTKRLWTNQFNFRRRSYSASYGQDLYVIRLLNTFVCCCLFFLVVVVISCCCCCYCFAAYVYFCSYAQAKHQKFIECLCVAAAFVAVAVVAEVVAAVRVAIGVVAVIATSSPSSLSLAATSSKPYQHHMTIICSATHWSIVL